MDEQIKPKDEGAVPVVATPSEPVVSAPLETVPSVSPASAPAHVPRNQMRDTRRGPQNRMGGRGGQGGGRGGGRPGGRDRGPRQERAKSEFDQKTIDVRRVARVVAGGRRFSFRVSIIAGDKNGRVGVGLGKGGDTALAIDKALRDAKKNMIMVRRTDTGSIPHQVNAKYKSAKVMLQPAPGRGVIAGSSVRAVLELAGVKDVVGKIFSKTKNKLNIARGAIKALTLLQAPRQMKKKTEKK